MVMREEKVMLKDSLYGLKLYLHSKRSLKLYGKILKPEFDDKDLNKESVSLQISLLTEKMINYDNTFFHSPEDDKNGYYPYIFEFVAEMDIKLFKLIPHESFGQWIPMKLIDLEKKEDNGNEKNSSLFIPGTLVFAASPIWCVEKALYIEKTDLESIKQDPMITKMLNTVKIPKGAKRFFQEEAKQRIGELTSFAQEFMVKVYHVGRGNFIELQMDSHSILFDIGRTIFENLSKTIETNVMSFRSLHPEGIILSHWDLDHIACVGDLNPEIIYAKGFPWIAPDLSLLPNAGITQSALKLCCYVAYKASLYLCNSLGNCILGNVDQNFSLWQGKGKKGKFTKANNIGLIIRLRMPGHPEKKALLPGDCEYRMMPDALVNKSASDTNGNYFFMVASHHGAEQNVGSLVHSDENIYSLCVVTAGKDHINGKTYPHCDYETQIRNNNFFFITTMFRRKEIFRIPISQEFCSYLMDLVGP